MYYKFTKKMSYAAWITLRMDDKTDSVHEDMKLQKNIMFKQLIYYGEKLHFYR